MLNSQIVKEKARQMGADLCNIAPVNRFKNAPEGFHPHDISPECQSVIVFASQIPLSTLQAKTNAPYTFVRNMLAAKIDQITFQLSGDLERKGLLAIPVPSDEPYDYWDAEQRQGRGILSLRHAGFLAGLGVLGKNTLLVNETFGNMIWLGAILISEELEPDPLASYTVCPPKCNVCITSCPQQALDGTTVNQKRCRKSCISSTEGGGFVYSCNICRKICPQHKGVQ